MALVIRPLVLTFRAMDSVPTLQRAALLLDHATQRVSLAPLDHFPKDSLLRRLSLLLHAASVSTPITGRVCDRLGDFVLLLQRWNVQQQDSDTSSHSKILLAAAMHISLFLVETSDFMAYMRGRKEPFLFNNKPTPDGEVNQWMYDFLDAFFQMTCSTTCSSVHSPRFIHHALYCVNPAVFLRYETRRRHLEQKNEGFVERLTFHGTTESNIDSILRHGFGVGGRDVPVKHGKVHGTGIYSSESAAFALRYAKAAEGCPFLSLLVCRVLITPDSRLTPSINGRIHEIVIQHVDQILPTFLIRIGESPQSASTSSDARWTSERLFILSTTTAKVYQKP